MKGFKTFGLFFIFLFLVLSLEIYAVSLSPEVVEKLRREGRLDEWVAQDRLAREQGLDQPDPNPPIKFGKDGSLVTDTLKPIVICVDFNDNLHSHDTSEFSLLLFSKNFVYPTGSMRDYYLENSYGKLDVMGGITGWYKMPQTYAYYVNGQRGTGAYPRNSQKLAEDAVNAADPYVNFANYDYDGDGWVDGLIIVFAGPDAQETGDDNRMSAHKWQMPSVLIRDGVRLQPYNMDPEEHPDNTLMGMGTFAHEYGHTLGMPDLYDYGYDSDGVGKWSIMASGSLINNGETPSHFDAFCKYKLGFSQVTRLTANQTNVEILQAETSPISYRLWKNGGLGSRYFLVDNRQKIGFDRLLPTGGLLIYHVDESMPNNDNQWCPGQSYSPHYKVAVEQADGFFQLEWCSGSNEGDAGDPFPGYRNKRAFDDTTTPSSRNYHTDSVTQVAVWNISDSDSSMHANMDVSWSRPCLYLMTFSLSDPPPGGNGNGRAEGGETVKLYFSIKNIWLSITNTTVTGSADTAGITFTDNSSYLGTIGTGSTVNNNSDPIEFVVDPNFPGRPTIFTLHVQGNTTSGPYTLDFNKEVWAGNAQLLIVDDDSGSAGDYESYYTIALDSLREIYDIWDTQGKGDPDFTFNKYKYLIWYTGDHKTDLFTQAQVESLMSFLDKGGRLFLTSQDAAEVLSRSANPLFQEFLTDYLHCSFVDDTCTQRLIIGEPGDTVGDTLYIQTYGVGSAQNQTSKDVLLPTGSAVSVLRYVLSGWVSTDSVAGIRYEGDYYKLVFFGFGFEGLNPSGQLWQGHYLSKPHFVMQRVLNFLKGPLPTIDVISPNGGETWFIGDTADILWECISFAGNVKIDYSTNAGREWSTIVETTPCDGNYSWLVPDSLTPSDSCLVRISDIDNGIPIDSSDGYFSIISYVPGDPNGDGVVSSADVVYLINYLFIGGPAPNPLAAGDANGDCVVSSADVVYLINYLFIGGPAPQPGCA